MDECSVEEQPELLEWKEEHVVEHDRSNNKDEHNDINMADVIAWNTPSDILILTINRTL